MSSSSFVVKPNRFRIQKTAKYKNGVSTAATSTLNRKPLIRSSVKISQGKTSNEHKRNKTLNVSTNCDRNVEKLFLNQRCFPLVNLFQKWNIEMSIYCANKYAIIEAKTAMAEFPNTFKNNLSFIGESASAGTLADTQMISNENNEAKIPVVTTWLARFLP